MASGIERALLNWSSPFPQEPACLQRLEMAGLEPWPQDPATAPAGTLFLYDPPDRVLSAAHAQGLPALTADELLEGYTQLLEHSGNGLLLASWRLDPLEEPTDLGAWLQARAEHLDQHAFPQPEALSALIARALLEAMPPLQEAYQDLEMRAELAGSDPDTAYLQRLRSAVSPQALLASWWAPTASQSELDAALAAGERQRQELAERIESLTAEGSSREEALASCRQEAELSLLQLHQVQEELEVIFLADREKQKRLTQLEEEASRREQELGDLGEQLQAALKKVTDSASDSETLSNRLRDRDQEATSLREACLATRRQVQQLQEELERSQRQRSELDERLRSLQALAEATGRDRDALSAQLAQEQQAAAAARQQSERQVQQLEELSEQVRAGAELHERLARQEQETSEVRQESELTLMQLHQVQEELEHYFLLARGQQDLLERHEQLERRSQRMLAAVIKAG